MKNSLAQAPSTACGPPPSRMEASLRHGYGLKKRAVVVVFTEAGTVNHFIFLFRKFLGGGTFFKKSPRGAGRGPAKVPPGVRGGALRYDKKSMKKQATEKSVACLVF